MAEILPMRRITLINQSNQSINHSINQSINLSIYQWSIYIHEKKIAKVIITVYQQQAYNNLNDKEQRLIFSERHFLTSFGNDPHYSQRSAY